MKISLPLLLSIWCVFSSLTACNQEAAESQGVTAEKQLSPAADGAQRFGGALTLSATTPLAKILASPAEFAGKTVLTEATVRQNCTKRGCWMEIAESKESPGCRVTFKDYGFFVPLDSQGALARVEGVVSVKTVPAEDVAHYEAEGGSFADKQPDGSAKEVHIVATGVELKKS